MARTPMTQLAKAAPFDANNSASGVAINRLAPNPLNPRQTLGDLSELAASLKTNGQLQAITVVSRAAYNGQHPELATEIGAADYVVIMGNRRLAAAREAGLARLDILVKDSLAAQAETLTTAPVAENIDRRDFDPIEEALAVQGLVDTFAKKGKKKGDVATQLGRSNGWVSQRLALLSLHPDVQELVRVGTIPVRVARDLAKLDADEQMAAWQARPDKVENFTAVKNEAFESPADGGDPVDVVAEEPLEDAVVPDQRVVEVDPGKVFKRLGGRPETLAAAMRSYADSGGAVDEMADAITAGLDPAFLLSLLRAMSERLQPVE